MRTNHALDIELQVRREARRVRVRVHDAQTDGAEPIRRIHVRDALVLGVGGLVLDPATAAQIHRHVVQAGTHGVLVDQDPLDECVLHRGVERFPDLDQLGCKDTLDPGPACLLQLDVRRAVGLEMHAGDHGGQAGSVEFEAGPRHALDRAANQRHAALAVAVLDQHTVGAAFERRAHEGVGVGRDAVEALGLDPDLVGRGLREEATEVGAAAQPGEGVQK